MYTYKDLSLFHIYMNTKYNPVTKEDIVVGNGGDHNEVDLYCHDSSNC